MRRGKGRKKKKKKKKFKNGGVDETLRLESQRERDFFVLGNRKARSNNKSIACIVFYAGKRGGGLRRRRAWRRTLA